MMKNTIFNTNSARLLAGAIFILLARALFADEVIPPLPNHNFNDYAQGVRPAVARELDEQLAGFEKETNARVIVAIYPRKQSDASPEDYAMRIADAWKKEGGKEIGILFVIFAQDHQMSLRTGGGVEKTIPDPLCKKILENEVTPHFNAGDFNGGLVAAVNALAAALHGEYEPVPKPSPAAAH